MDLTPIAKIVAIIDDDAQVRETLSRLLRTYGYLTRSYATATDFLSSLVKCDAECLIIDVRLGSMCGIELARHPYVAALKLPVIFITGSPKEETRSKALESGCVAYLHKPFRSAELLGAIAKATGTGVYARPLPR